MSFYWQFFAKILIKQQDLRKIFNFQYFTLLFWSLEGFLSKETISETILRRESESFPRDPPLETSFDFLFLLKRL